MLLAGSAPDGLGGFTFGSGSVRRASDGRCHFTITTGNTQPGPDAMPLAQEVSCTAETDTLTTLPSSRPFRRGTFTAASWIHTRI